MLYLLSWKPARIKDLHIWSLSVVRFIKILYFHSYARVASWVKFMMFAVYEQWIANVTEYETFLLSYKWYRSNNSLYETYLYI